MDTQRNDLLAEMARDAALERSDFLVRAGEQLERFLSDQAGPDPRARGDHPHRRRPGLPRDRAGRHLPEPQPRLRRGDRRVAVRYRDHRDRRRARGALQPGRHLPGLCRRRPRGRLGCRGRGRQQATAATRTTASARRSKARTRTRLPPTSGPQASRRFPRRTPRKPPRPRSTSSRSTSRSGASGPRRASSSSSRTRLRPLMSRVGTIVIVDDLDEHLELAGPGFRGKVIPEGETQWTDLGGPEEIVRFYDPTDVFGDLAEAIADAFPGVAPDDEDDGRTMGTALGRDARVIDPSPAA